MWQINHDQIEMMTMTLIMKMIRREKNRSGIKEREKNPHKMSQIQLIVVRFLALDASGNTTFV